jgi:hypothetical protein
MTAFTFTETLSRENHVLGRHFIDDHAQIDAHHLLDDRHQQEETRPFRAGVAPEREDDAAFILA